MKFTVLLLAMLLISCNPTVSKQEGVDEGKKIYVGNLPFSAIAESISVVVTPEGVNVAVHSKAQSADKNKIKDIIQLALAPSDGSKSQIQTILESSKGEDVPQIAGFVSGNKPVLLLSKGSELSFIIGSAIDKLKTSVLKKDEGGRHTPFRNRFAALSYQNDGTYIVSSQMVGPNPNNELDAIQEFIKVSSDGKVLSSQEVSVNPIKWNNENASDGFVSRSKIYVADGVIASAFQTPGEEASLVRLMQGQNSSELIVKGYPLDVWTDGKNVRTATKQSDCIAAIYENQDPVYKQQTVLGSCTAIKFLKNGDAYVVNVAPDDDKGITINTTHVEYSTNKMKNGTVKFKGQYISCKSDIDVDADGLIHLVYSGPDDDCDKRLKLAGTDVCDLDQDGKADLALHHVKIGRATSELQSQR